mgnify:CR=1 FL=1
MTIEVRITSEPLRLEPTVIEDCGAVARFDGLVRGTENGEVIRGLHYEAYLPMAERLIHSILVDLADKHPFALARVHHRTGFVPVGEAAILIDVHARHRAEAFLVLQKFMDLLKQEVPIWKTKPLQP